MARRLAVCALALTAVAVCAPAADAAKVELSGGRLTYTADPGEANQPKGAHYDAQSGEWTVEDFPELMEAGGGCEAQPFAFSVTCSDGAAPISALFILGDADDHYSAVREGLQSEGVTTYTDVREPFAASVDGGPGRDDLWAAASGSPITISGGDDADRIVFFPPEPGEPPTPPGRYLLAGDAGDDWIQAQAGVNGSDPGAGLQIEGGPGTDELRGSAGPDQLSGGPGEDRIWDSAGNDSISGGDDADEIYGAEGNNVISGGDGDDHISAGAGANQVFGDAGNDTINVRNIAFADDVGCGEGTDRVVMETALDQLGTDCEFVEIAERCPRGRAPCAQIVTMIAPRPRGRAATRRAPRRRGLILGRARTRIPDAAQKGRIPLSASGRSFIERRGLARVWRVSRVSAPRSSRRSR